jgi:Sulfotransferase family
MKNRQRMPDFLGIGGARCGSTWLYCNLQAHPELWLPPVKELHYFTRSLDYQTPSYLASDRLWERAISRKPYNRGWRRRALKDLAGALSGNLHTIPWILKYYFGRPSDAWYASLFRAGRNRLCGEITPGYALLKVQDIARVRKLMPDAKVLLMLRNPVDRLWSHYRMDFMSEDEFKRLLRGQELDPRGDFLSILANWESVFPPEQMFIGFYDEIQANPVGLLTAVHQFLGVDASAERIPASLFERVYAGPTKSMPAEIRLALTEKYLAQITGLSERFGGHATKWLEAARATLAGRVDPPEGTVRGGAPRAA